ncbi:hypothetical protein FM103_11155 [Corynebacterium xerosis]|nr:hypothetical protein FM103_11155 [Corynebacterium xerosis]
MRRPGTSAGCADRARPPSAPHQNCRPRTDAAPTIGRDAAELTRTGREGHGVRGSAASPRVVALTADRHPQRGSAPSARQRWGNAALIPPPLPH